MFAEDVNQLRFHDARLVDIVTHFAKPTLLRHTGMPPQMASLPSC